MILAIAGPWMCVLGAIWTNFICIQRLTDYVYIGTDMECTGRLGYVTKVFLALRRCLSMLEEYYRHLPIQKSPDRFFPRFRTYTNEEGQTMGFQYIGPLVENATKPIFLAKTTAGRRIVVKFVRQYNALAHSHLASLNLAPALLHHGPIALGTRQSYLLMVVMDFIEGRTAQELWPEPGERLPNAIREEVERAVEELHGIGIVFADLRKPNIMVTGDINAPQVKLVDFDWCGIHESGRYPITLNDNENEMKWHPDVERNGIMSRDHDNWMLGKL
jgi:serine/threonine protein kinase